MNFKTLRKLTQKKYRREMGLWIIEGEKIVSEHKDKAVAILTRGENIDEKSFDAVSSLETSQGVMAVVPVPRGRMEVRGNVLVLDRIQDPGNVGTLLRTAKAFGFGTVFCIDSADAWSQKVLRSASGVQLGMNIVECGLDEFLAWYAGNGDLPLITADMGGCDIGEFAPTKCAFGLVLGNEGSGVCAQLKTLAKHVVSVPMQNGVESLNVAVAGGILMYKLGG